MIHYANHPGASISMSSNEKFIKALDRLFNEHDIAYVFESGTFNGLGSTTKLAKAIVQSGKPIKQFITVEISKKYYTQAKKNLAAYEFVTPAYGLTVGFDEARKFIDGDDAIKNHDKYPEIFIDNTDNPVKFYSDEIEGHLAQESLREKVANLFVRAKKTPIEEKLFEKYLTGMAGQTPLVLLDSAGGIGYLEFQLVMKIMDGRSFFLILDDIHHLKHFRSYKTVKEDNNFTILDESYEQGWAIAYYEEA